MFKEFVGQQDTIEPLVQEILASSKTGRQIPHMLFLGPPGSGKTMLAKSLAKELKKPFEVLHCPNAEDRAAVYDKIIAAQGGILFCEEVHALRRDFAEDLYTLIDENVITGSPVAKTKVVEYPDGWVDIEYGGGSESPRTVLKPVTVIGATTDEARLPEAFLSRLSGLVVRMKEYRMDDLTRIAADHATDSGEMEIEVRAAKELAKRCRQNPRRLKQLVDRSMARAINEGSILIELRHVRMTMNMLGVDDYGLEEPHRKMLRLLTNPVSRTTLAQKMGIPAKNVDLYFGELAKLGFVEIDRKHQITDEGRKVINHARA